MRLLTLMLTIVFFASTAGGETYYLNAAAPGPVFDGSQSNPWQTVEQMQQFLHDLPDHGSGDTVLIAGGSYGDWVDGAYSGDGHTSLQNAQLTRTDWLTLKAADVNDPPEFRSLRMYGVRDAYMRYDGLHVISRTPHVYGDCVFIRNGVRHVQLLNLDIEAEDDMLQLPTGIYITYNDPTDILIEGCEVHDVDTAISAGADDLVIRNNEVHHIASSAMKTGGGDNMLVEGNYIHHQVSRIIRINLYGTQVGTFTKGESITQAVTGAHATVYIVHADRLEVTPDNKVQYEFVVGQPVYSDDTSNQIVSVTNVTDADRSHGSGLSVRTNGYSARGNVIHDYGSSAGIFVYPIGSPYTNMLFENNLVYDAITRTVVLNDVSDNFVLRNNTFVGGVHAYFDDTNDGSGLHLYNNLLTVLTVWYPAELPNIVEGRNILRSISTRSPYNNYGAFPAGSTSLMYGYDQPASLFDDLFVDAAGLDFHLADDSDAIDFGDPANAPAIDLEGTARDALPDAGAYEADSSGARVIARHIFYNNSAFDGNDAAANAADDGAIATDKVALLSGETATSANYTSYVKGINGVMLDVLNGPASLSAGDFEFKTGNTTDPATWPDAPAPTQITIRPGQGTSGTDRVTITWPDGAITKQWLQVKMLANTNTTLSSDSVFYIGNAIGDTCNSAGDTVVNAADEIACRNNTRNFVRPAVIDDLHDFNRDAKVDATDEIIARNNVTDFNTALQLITIP